MPVPLVQHQKVGRGLCDETRTQLFSPTRVVARLSARPTGTPDPEPHRDRIADAKGQPHQRQRIAADVISCFKRDRWLKPPIFYWLRQFNCSRAATSGTLWI